MELSKNKISFITSLKQKKYRNESGFFLVEGHKMVNELLSSDWKVVTIIATNIWLKKNIKYLTKDIEIFEVSDSILERLSALKSPSTVLAVVKQKEYIPQNADIKNELIIALDNIQDPGNMGTIIRLADWFGIKNVICSPSCADLYNTKTIQATMGSFLRVNVSYCNLTEFINNFKQSSNIEIFGAFLEGENIYSANLPKNGIIIMGNEGNGISKEIETLVTRKITIPSFINDATHSESLNVSVATAIVCSEFRRRII